MKSGSASLCVEALTILHVWSRDGIRKYEKLSVVDARAQAAGQSTENARDKRRKS
jgi:cytidine deaminase